MSQKPATPPIFFSYGFRPFFLFAGLYAIAALTAWLAWLGLHLANAVVTQPSFAVAPHEWHGHEMIFGYAAAVVAGFLLTAVPSWTGAKPLAGAPLVLLAGLWLAGRAAMWTSAFLPAALVAVADLAFLPVLAAFAARDLMLKPAPRNLIFLALLALLIAANAGIHLGWTGFAEGGAVWGLHTGVVTLALLVTLIGGRIVPAFTRNALMRRGQSDPLPRSFAPLELFSIGGSLAVALCFATDAGELPTGIAALIAAVANLARLALWRFADTRGEPILWSLHLGYLWLPVGFAALAVSALTGAFPEILALHALAIGAIGGMTLAVMTRASLGHTDRPLTVSPPITIAYLCVAVAALVRVAGPSVLPDHYLVLTLVSGGFWVAGFAIFAVVYWPILVGPPLSAKGKV